MYSLGVIKTNRPRFALAAVAAVVVLSGCADREASTVDSAASEDTDESSAQDGPTINWDSPYGDSAPEFVRVEDAMSGLAFDPLTLAEAEPDLIQLSPPSESRSIVMIFHLEAEGTVMVEETPASEKDIEGLRAMVEARNADAADGLAEGETASVATYEMIPFRDTEALFVQARGIGRIVWIESGIRIDITGERITPEQVLELAASLAKS